MDEQWLGKAVDLNCGALGVFQGVIGGVHLDEQTITIKNVIHNGVPSKMSSVTIEARDIKSIEFVQTNYEANGGGGGSAGQHSKPATSTITTVAKKKNRNVAESLAHQNSQGRKYPASPYDHRTSPRKGFEQQQRVTPKPKYYSKDDGTFVDIDMDNMGKDFDFERNLALFDKQRVLEEIESNQPDVVRLIDHNRRGASSASSGAKHKTTSVETKSAKTAAVMTHTNTSTSSTKTGLQPLTSGHGFKSELEPKYRNDQNVLASEPTQYRLIATDEAAVGEYTTDAGLVVPALSYQLRERCMAAAEAKGISRDRLIEIVARSGTEVAIQLLGGSRRLNPQNSHQVPLCVVLCGPGKSGEYGMAIGRHLASQGVKTITFFPQLDLYQRQLANELNLYKLCCKSQGSKLIHEVKELPQGTAVDLVVMALDDHDLWEQERNQPWHRGAVRWCRDLRAPVLALDPLASPLPLPLPYKASVIPGLPLWYEGTDYGQVSVSLLN